MIIRLIKRSKMSLTLLWMKPFRILCKSRRIWKRDSNKHRKDSKRGHNLILVVDQSLEEEAAMLVRRRKRVNLASFQRINRCESDQKIWEKLL
jgi:uncharacterized protein with PIN domain